MKEIVSEYLVDLYNELKKARNTASKKDIEDFSARVCHASALHEKRVAHLQAEQKRITRYNDLIWKQFMSIMDPFWKVEEEMLPLYEQIKSIYLDLDSLSQKPIPSPKATELAQNRLNEFENKFREDGRYIINPDQTGHAVINGMLEECYKMTRNLNLREPEIDESLIPIKEKLEYALAELEMIHSVSETDKSIDFDHLKSLQENLDLIDSQQMDGKFLDKNGNPPKGQEYIKYLLEASYDKVNDILLNLESDQKEGEHYESLKDLISNAQGLISNFSKETLQISKSKVEELAKMVSDTLLHPKESMEGVSSKVLSLIRSGESLLSKVYLQIEPISNELMPISEKLNEIKSFLLKTRNEFNKDITYGTKKSSIKNEMIKVQSELDEIDRSRINGKFVDEKIQYGQYHLSSLLNECYCLMYDLANRI